MAAEKYSIDSSTKTRDWTTETSTPRHKIGNGPKKAPARRNRMPNKVPSPKCCQINEWKRREFLPNE